MRRRWLTRATVVGALTVMAAAGASGAADAHDASNTSYTAIVSVTDYFAPYGSYDNPYNGYRVFLSSPRHSDSGSRGECRSPGYEENVNGRRFNMYSANGDYLGTSYAPTSTFRNLHSRGYYTAVSRNTRDNGYLANRTESQNWGANIHIITHTNALTGGCGAGGDYLLTMYNSSTDKALSDRLLASLDGPVPGPAVTWQRTDLAELFTNASNGDTYVEVQFHTNPTRQSWLATSMYQAGSRYGAGVDVYLNYP